MTIKLKTLIAIFILSFAIVISGGLATFASSEADITFPIVELGGCEDQGSCETYCEDSAHINECIAFAESHNLLTDLQIEEAKRFKNAGSVGPGGCDSAFSCEVHCNDINNINECIAYGEEHGFLEGEDLEEAKAVQRALAQGAELPGGCTNKDSCEVYCSDAAHSRECLDFAVQAGFIDEDELPYIERALAIMNEGRSPGGCNSEFECEEYCSEASHFDECIAFAEEAGFISSEDAEFARKTGGVGPGG